LAFNVNTNNSSNSIGGGVSVITSVFTSVCLSIRLFVCPYYSKKLRLDFDEISGGAEQGVAQETVD